MPLVTTQTTSIRSNSSSNSNYSDASSGYSVSTASTVHSVRPSIRQYKSIGYPVEHNGWADLRCSHLTCARPGTSVDTYAPTVSSMDDLDDDLPPFNRPDFECATLPLPALASSPQEFAELFPSIQRLSIKHDDTTMDGNMNLRVDTEARTLDGGRIDLTLFHLRMYDLKRREFSLRRYCRDSGQEVCHSSRKYTKPSVMRRPGLQRSMSNALSSLRSKSDNKTPTAPGLKRHDSGYGSMHEEAMDDEFVSQSQRGPSNIPIPTNTTQLEFSNYAHLEVKRRGAKSSKRYELEYWGNKYAWKRVAVKSGNFKDISYHLVDTKTSNALAHIVQVPLSTPEIREENAKGGWVPPCNMFLEDSVLTRSTDLADVIVASGLIALVDDCIKSRWHQKSRVHITIPKLARSPLKMNMEYAGPKHLIEDVFKAARRQLADPLPLHGRQPANIDVGLGC